MEKAGMIKWAEQNMNPAQNAGLGTTSQGTTTARHGASAATITSVEREVRNMRQAILNQQLMMMEAQYVRHFSGLSVSSQNTLSASYQSMASQSPPPSSEDSFTTPDETNSSSPTMTKTKISPVFKQGTLTPIGQVKASTMDVDQLPPRSKSTKLKPGVNYMTNWAIQGASVALEGSIWDHPMLPEPPEWAQES